jgi:hypothetical protein
MPLGLNRIGDFRDGSPLTLPHNFGDTVTLPKNFGNPAIPATFGSPVTLPKNFGNIIGGGPSTTSGFLLEDGSGVILLESGDILLLETSS